MRSPAWPNRRRTGSDAQLPSIIVLPFINLSGDAKRDYLADGITDSLISDLVRALPGIAIVSRDTAFTYKGRGADARQIGRELGVRYLLAGSVVFEGERVRVNIQLAETKEGSQLWAERFDTERTGILQVQDEIVARVSRAIGLKVVDIEARRSSRERPSSAELIDLIMRGKAVLNLPSSPATMIEARGLFEQALKVEPSNVDGLAGVATTLVFEFLNGYYETGDGERLREAELLLDQRGHDRAPSPHGLEGEGGAPAHAGQIRRRHCRGRSGRHGKSRRAVGLQGDRLVDHVSRPARNKPSTGSPRPIASGRVTRDGGPGWTVEGTRSSCSGGTRRPSTR